MSHTIYDIARKAGVSIATVSRVFNESSKVSAATRKKVLHIANKVGYQPQGYARGLASRQSNVIIAVVPLLSNYFFLQVLNGIQGVISETDFELHIYNVKPEENPLKQLKRLLGRRWADGYLFVSVHLDEDDWAEVARLNQRMVLIDDAYSGCDYFQINNKKGARKATKFFLDRGFEHIGMITAAKRSIPAGKRCKGFLEIQREYGLTPDDSLVVRGSTAYRDGFNERNGYEAMHQLLALDSPPEAVVCVSDIQAIGALSAMKEQGIRIPIIGYDDIQLSEYIGLSTMRQPMYKMGREGARLLLDSLSERPSELVQENYTPELILRSTTNGIEQ
ncbi:LacI family DNA-binding transcriptional regulator [Fodinibius sediminis]|uniref:Transcriptional regulator, LacI family n=1 Tax=Fodinibius sediminis TaxID=1214077 RepID=A0A521DB24_9BACT|nr:LacI family DNA-binding transcriptional regulator [Fodinibius sediminis]SMO68802.1 transcriptional regulator, LacI family [Fodinibius sediminis]